MSDDTRSFDDVRDEVTGDDYGFIRPSAKRRFGAANESDDAKETTGTIAGHSFTLRVDGDAPGELVAEIEAALASVKAGGFTPNSELRELIEHLDEVAHESFQKQRIQEFAGLTHAKLRLEALIDDTQAGDGE